jgi:hypothetical protein
LHLSSVHFVIEEKLTVVATKDGALESMTVNGSMLLKVNDDSGSRIAISVAHPQNAALVFSTHPKVDKAKWTSSQTIQLKDPSQAFPIGQPLAVLKWRLSSTDPSNLPLQGCLY